MKGLDARRAAARFGCPAGASGTVPVIVTAEDLVAATSDLELNEKDGARFQRQAEAGVAAQGAFLDVCREDLS
ncbi:hypothetical protein ABZX39_32605 [Streptomyces collinus]|uniref:hypothetical protein n=1 Tax=Streptomyces collinus TaxID=42684 RepID=UPI0033B6E24F